MAPTVPTVLPPYGPGAEGMTAPGGEVLDRGGGRNEAPGGAPGESPRISRVLGAKSQVASI